MIVECMMTIKINKNSSGDDKNFSLFNEQIYGSNECNAGGNGENMEK